MTVLRNILTVIELGCLLGLAFSVETTTEDHSRIASSGEVCEATPNEFITPIEAGGCEVDHDCDKHPYYFCNDNKECEHKAVFPPEGLEIAGIFVFGFIMALCTVAGIGGGGIANSMLIYFFKFETKPAVAISSFSILICTTMRFFYNFSTKHPEKNTMNVLDYGLASIMMPTTLAGSQIGGYVLLMFPSIYI